jgi:hypothetical protein
MSTFRIYLDAVDVEAPDLAEAIHEFLRDFIRPDGLPPVIHVAKWRQFPDGSQLAPAEVCYGAAERIDLSEETAAPGSVPHPSSDPEEAQPLI